MTGYGPSGPPSGAGGKATETSSGMPSQVGICAVAVPQKRCPDAWTAQLTGAAVFVNTCGIAAVAVDGANHPAASTAAADSILRICFLLRKNPPAIQAPRARQITGSTDAHPAGPRSPGSPAAAAARGSGPDRAASGAPAPARARAG